MPRPQTKTAAKPVSTPVSSSADTMGTVRKTLPKPQRVADLTAVQVIEIKERRRLLEAAASRIEDESKLLTLARNDYNTFLQRIITANGLNKSNDYNIDSESGVIWQTSEHVAVTPEVVELEEETKTEDS